MLKKFKYILKQLEGLFYSNEKNAFKAGVKLGKNNFIASKFWSSEPYLIEVGNNCQITNGVRMFTHGGGGAVRLKYEKFDCFGKIKIGNYVYIGTNSLIMPGVQIDDNVLIAAGSVVTNSIPSNVVVGGNPAKIICTIDQYIEKNMQYNMNTAGIFPRKKKRLLLDTQESKFIKKKYLSINCDK